MTDAKYNPGSGSRWEPSATPGTAVLSAGTTAATEAPTTEVPYQAATAEPTAYEDSAGDGTT